MQDRYSPIHHVSHHRTVQEAEEPLIYHNPMHLNEYVIQSPYTRNIELESTDRQEPHVDLYEKRRSDICKIEFTLYLPG